MFQCIFWVRWTGSEAGKGCARPNTQRAPGFRETWLCPWLPQDTRLGHGNLSALFNGALSERPLWTSISQILEAWWTTTDCSGINSDEMYLVQTPHTPIRPVRAAMSSFASQIVEAQLMDEAQTAIQETSGLHASVAGETDDASVQWAGIGATLIPTVKTAFQTHQPLAFHYMRKIAHAETSPEKWCYCCPYLPSTRTCKSDLLFIDLLLAWDGRLLSRHFLHWISADRGRLAY